MKIFQNEIEFYFYYKKCINYFVIDDENCPECEELLEVLEIIDGEADMYGKYIFFFSACNLKFDGEELFCFEYYTEIFLNKLSLFWQTISGMKIFSSAEKPLTMSDCIN